MRNEEHSTENERDGKWSKAIQFNSIRFVCIATDFVWNNGEKKEKNRKRTEWRRELCARSSQSNKRTLNTSNKHSASIFPPNKTQRNEIKLIINLFSLPFEFVSSTISDELCEPNQTKPIRCDHRASHNRPRRWQRQTKMKTFYRKSEAINCGVEQQQQQQHEQKKLTTTSAQHSAAQRNHKIRLTQFTKINRFFFIIVRRVRDGFARILPVNLQSDGVFSSSLSIIVCCF